MPTTVAKCPNCTAKINVHWKACLVCRAPIESETSREAVHPPNANDGNVPMPGCYVRWQRGDGSQAKGKVLEVLVAPSVDPPIVVLVTLDDGSEATLNPRTVKLWVMDESRGQK